MTVVKCKSVAVYCGSSLGTEGAFFTAAMSLGHAIAKDSRALVYGGGTDGIMGAVSAAVLQEGGEVTGIIPYAMVASGGEKDKVTSDKTVREGMNDMQRVAMTTIVVNSMHDRKVEMARRSDGFVALPGGFGTFEEVFEVTTWTQIGIHNKPVILANVLGYWNPLRQLINTAIDHGFIRPENTRLITFVDGPADFAEHLHYDWGTAVLDALDNWTMGEAVPMFDWSKRLGDKITDAGKLAAT
ncbi:hypothetical protein M378DRAFT_156869 [Amanita muscaria Koide BX008]|uniref:Cytokinin riboside 5'-monophosphate phosphoribohydrolase n=1 Tax=Amanita muscaria (strain Koide BX008) TaxID=946122 RepID=A0A0C2X5P1_AMAMK|nr:hypothetical protein M378DRAFT_156869 [Amanita muscaria Koide BX008]